MGKLKGVNSELAELFKLAEDQGWTVEWTKKGHVRLTPNDPNMPTIFAASTPSDWRGVKNMKSRMKRAGLKVD